VTLLKLRYNKEIGGWLCQPFYFKAAHKKVKAGTTART